MTITGTFVEIAATPKGPINYLSMTMFSWYILASLCKIWRPKMGFGDISGDDIHKPCVSPELGSKNKKHLRGSTQATILPLAIILTAALWALVSIIA